MSPLRVYVLRLAGGKWYVGRTNKNVDERFEEHLRGDGCGWTKKYPPESLSEIKNNADDFDEDKVVKKYMAEYGIDNVRGGSYVTERLGIHQIKFIRREIWMAQGRCLRCGREGHFARKCWAATDVDGKPLKMKCWKCKQHLGGPLTLQQHICPYRSDDIEQ